MPEIRKRGLANNNIVGTGVSPLNPGNSQSTASRYAPTNTSALPTGFVNGDRLISQNSGALQQGIKQVQDQSSALANKASHATDSLNPVLEDTNKLGVSDVLDLAASAGKGDETAKKRLANFFNQENQAANTVDWSKINEEKTNLLKSNPMLSGGLYGDALDSGLGAMQYGGQIKQSLGGIDDAVYAGQKKLNDVNDSIKLRNDSLGKAKEYRDHLMNNDDLNERGVKIGSLTDALKAVKNHYTNPLAEWYGDTAMDDKKFNVDSGIGVFRGKDNGYSEWTPEIAAKAYNALAPYMASGGFKPGDIDEPVQQKSYNDIYPLPYNYKPPVVDTRTGRERADDELDKKSAKADAIKQRLSSRFDYY